MNKKFEYVCCNNSQVPLCPITSKEHRKVLHACCFNSLQECIPVLNFNVPGGAVVYSCACAQMLRADFSTPQQSEDLSLDMTMLYTEVRWSNMALPSAPSTETKNKLCGWYWKVQL